MEMNEESDKTMPTVNVGRRFPSECTVPSDDETISPGRIRSLPDFESGTNYDDICGPWKFLSVPLRSRCICPSAKLITSEDVTHMRGQRDKKSVLLFLGERFMRFIRIRHMRFNEIRKFLFSSKASWAKYRTDCNLLRLRYLYSDNYSDKCVRMCVCV